MTLFDRIIEHLAKSGVREVAAVRVVIDGEEPLLIKSASDPVLNRDVGDGSGITIVVIQSASAGFRGSSANSLLANPGRSGVSVVEQVTAKVAALPLEQQREALALIEALESRTRDSATQRSLRLKGATAGPGPKFTLESLKEARREMWGEYVESGK